MALAAVVPLFAIVHLAMRSWTGRLEDADEHVATVDRLYLSTIGALSTAIEAKDGVTSSHIHRVQHYAMGLAQSARRARRADPEGDRGRGAAARHRQARRARAHPQQARQADAAEFETMKLHVDVGADILSSIDFPYPVVPIVRAHHENWDGTGYPNGLKGTRHSDRRPHSVGRRLLRRADLRSPVSRGDDGRGGAGHHSRPPRHLYDPAVVDIFERVCRDIGPLTVKPQLQKAIQQITKAANSAPEPVAVPIAAPVTAARGRSGVVARARQPRARRQRQAVSRRRGVADLVARPSRGAERKLRVLRQRSGVGLREGGVCRRRRRADATGAVDEGRRTVDRVGRRKPAADREFGGDTRSRL